MSTKRTGRKIAFPMIAIIMGTLIAFIFNASAFKTNFGEVMSRMFIKPFTDSETAGNVLGTLAYLMLAGAAVAVGFKSGLFNIGVSGQMMISGAFVYKIGMDMGQNKSSSMVIFAIFMTILIGALYAGLAGFLKSFFNVNEVISTIMLNYVAVGIIDFIARKQEYTNNFGFPNNAPDWMLLRPGDENLNHPFFGTNYNYGIYIAIAVVIALIFVFKFTSFGFRLKINGVSQGATKYSGVNQKMQYIYAMLLSGAIAGLAGYIYYFGADTKIQSPGIMPIMAGFDGISITLLAYNNFFGLILISLFMAFFKLAQIGSDGGVEWMDLALGLIILIIASISYFITTPIKNRDQLKYVKKKEFIYHPGLPQYKYIFLKTYEYIYVTKEKLLDKFWIWKNNTNQKIDKKFEKIKMKLKYKKINIGGEKDDR